MYIVVIGNPQMKVQCDSFKKQENKTRLILYGALVDGFLLQVLLVLMINGSIYVIYFSLVFRILTNLVYVDHDSLEMSIEVLKLVLLTGWKHYDIEGSNHN
jgi:hypothetical protein